jgi:ketosteroid isomerase-like protein
MTDQEKRNLEHVERYEELYNTDPERFVRECYTADCAVHAMNGGTERVVIRGHDDFVALEKRVHGAAPKRRMQVQRTVASGNVVVAEAVLTNPDAGADWQSPFCAVLEFRDGKIAVDRTYIDPGNWPGLDWQG